MAFHAAHLETSPRLMSVFNLLKNRGDDGATSLEIVTICGVVNPGGAVSEIRKNIRPRGQDVECRKVRESENGKKVYRYFLVNIVLEPDKCSVCGGESH